MLQGPDLSEFFHRLTVQTFFSQRQLLLCSRKRELCPRDPRTLVLLLPPLSNSKDGALSTHGLLTKLMVWTKTEGRPQICRTSSHGL